MTFWHMYHSGNVITPKIIHNFQEECRRRFNYAQRQVGGNLKINFNEKQFLFVKRTFLSCFLTVGKCIL